jgi:murein DD-endopeptidase MepM/ murein hydrolase activator NlpD
VPAEPFRRRRAAQRAVTARGWLSHGAAALAVTVLGIAAAGSLASTTSAQPISSAPVSTPAPARAVPSASTDPAATAPFSAADRGSEPLRKAIVAERAAQRAEELAKSAEAVSRESRTASGQARQNQLTADEKATQVKAAELAKAALERAVAARAAATAARTVAEAAPTAEETATTPAAPAAPVVSSGGGVSPVPNAVVGARFHQYGLWSRYHTGLDFRAAYGVPIRAVKSGRVLYAGNSGDWAGNHVAIQHADGMTSMSSHMSRMAVSAGQTVQAGQVIGYVGQTGRAFGAHLHFEVYPAGVTYGDVYRAVDPVPWLLAAGVTTH